FPFVFNPLHLPTFLGPKQFGKHYWPSYKKVLLAIHEMGGKVLAMLEGDWHNFYEFLQELPKSMLIGAVEKDDLAVVKKEVGDTITLVGGVPLSMLRHNSKQQCIDETKRVLDHCAPGGGFIFANDKSLLSPGDIKIENLIAVNQYVKENGTY
ncbi:MAG TPA: uroporphyrinogen decarboxylase, partial [Eubacteriaceae bacterium]|nr:uroporphyrinogen decarboxylase [Eubacteriaceae bacterium]